MSAKHANDTNFEQSVLEQPGTVLVDFWAPWCGPCRMMGSVVDEVADESAESAQVVKVNVDESSEAAVKYGIQSIPAFVVFKDGKVQDKFAGVVSKQRLLDAIAG